MIRSVLAGAVLGLASLASAPALACDMVPPREIQITSKEKAPGWMVGVFTPQSRIEGHMLWRHYARRAFPDGKAQKTFLETEIGRAAAALYGRKPDKVALGMAETIDTSGWSHKTPARRFVVELAFGEQTLRASGFMRKNAERRDIAVIVALPNENDEARATELARVTAMHPGFDCH